MKMLPTPKNKIAFPVANLIRKQTQKIKSLTKKLPDSLINLTRLK